MLKPEWKQFKSGTDIRGVASDGVPGEPVNLTDETVRKMALGFSQWLCEKTKKQGGELTVSVGHDSRISAGRIHACVTEALTDCGIRVLSCGLASTPSMFMTTLQAGCDGAVQITASHHPFHRNGLKFFTREGGLDSPDIEKILLYAQEGKRPEKGVGQQEDCPFMDTYSAHLQEIIRQGVGAKSNELPLSGFHIVVDAGNGAGGFYASQVLAPLGADISGSQFLEPDGMFPNHIPNPENEEAMRSVCDAVIRSGADLGVIFDTDVDRGGAVDSEGREINRNRLVALASAIALDGNPGATVVTDSITSSGLKEYIEQTLGGKHHRFKRGYKNVINEAIRLNREGVNCPLAIETSGHAALRENHFLDDGAYLVTKIIIQMVRLRRKGESLASLLAPLKEPQQAVELRLPILEPDFRACGQRIVSNLEQYAKKNAWCIAPDNYEGIRVSFDKENGDGWFLLRLSVHDPILPLNMESDSDGGVKKIAASLAEFFASSTGVDTSALNQFLSQE